MFNIGVGLVNRIITILGLNELPDKVALQAHFTYVVRALFLIVLGSVLLGAFIVALLFITYLHFINSGYAELNVRITILAIGLILATLSFFTADICINKKLKAACQPKNFIEEKFEYFKNIGIGAVTGFIEGLTNNSKKRK